MDQLTSIDRTIDAPVLPGGLDTPTVVIDLDRVDSNIARMQDLLGWSWRAPPPHAKTHRSPFFAQRQLAAGAVGITVAVLGEAEVMADAGIGTCSSPTRCGRSARRHVASGSWPVASAWRSASLGRGASQLGRALDGADDRADVLDRGEPWRFGPCVARAGGRGDGRQHVRGGQVRVGQRRQGAREGQARVARRPRPRPAVAWCGDPVRLRPPRGGGPAAGPATAAVDDVITVVPDHACPVVDLTDELVLTRGGERVGNLPVLACGRNR